MKKAWSKGKCSKSLDLISPGFLLHSLVNKRNLFFKIFFLFLLQVTLPAGTQAVPSTIPHSGSSSISGSSSVASNEELIRRQQAEIEQLKRSLEVSQNALKEQQMALQLTQQNNEQIILSQQLRNNQVKKLFRRWLCQILNFSPLVL